MKATDLLRGWPDRGPEREAAILQAVANGHYLPIEWRPVTVERHGHQARFWIAQDALRVGDAQDSARVNVTAMTAQRLADRLGSSLPTTLMLDEVARQYTVQAEPCIQPPGRDSRLKAGLSPHMDDLGAMVTHSRQVDRAVKALTREPFVICNVGKHWVLSNRLTSKPNAAANYGWYSKSAPYLSASGMRMWQTLGTAHNTSHTDYSQVFQPVRNVVELDGVVLPLAEVLAHPEFWVALSDEGPLKVTRVPGVPTDDSPPPSNISQTFPPEELPTTPDLPEHLVSLYLEARNYTKADRSKEIRLVVLHTAEIAETLTSAEALARWCNGSGAPRASWHFAVDSDSITQSVKEEYVAWHAPGANRVGIGIEMCGRAAQTPEQWDDDFSRSVLWRTARLTASLCRRWNLPVQFVDAAALKYNVRGITTHAEVTKAFKQSTHTDPGKHFPMDEFLRLVREQG